MEEKSNIQEIQEIAKHTHREVIAIEEPYPVTGIRTFQKYKRLVYMPNDSENTSSLVWFGDFYPKEGTPQNFCGAFIPLPVDFTSKVNIKLRSVIDKISFGRRKKIGNDDFDSKFTISAEVSEKDKKFLVQSRMQTQLKAALKIEGVIHISINEYDLDFVPSLKGKPYLAIINPQMWIIDKDFIEKTFKQIEAIRDILNSNI